MVERSAQLVERSDRFVFVVLTVGLPPGGDVLDVLERGRWWLVATECGQCWSDPFAVSEAGVFVRANCAPTGGLPLRWLIHLDDSSHQICVVGEELIGPWDMCDRGKPWATHSASASSSA